ncbi:MAG: RluA family pseudouridine synthase [Planctomycetia bacterium]
MTPRRSSHGRHRPPAAQRPKAAAPVRPGASGPAEGAEPLVVLLEDDDVLVAVKPAGLPTANAAHGVPTLFSMVKSRLGSGGFVGVVSRLDAPVSGIVVMAKTRASAASLARQFRERSVEKSYVAICGGRFPAPVGQWVEWHDTIGRPEGEGDGPVRTQEAHVRARVIRRVGEVQLVELEPSSGRRHQLRAQLASRGCPIVGDRLYGSRLPFPVGIALHARALAFDHPVTRKRVRLERAPPESWKKRYPMLFRSA